MIGTRRVWASVMTGFAFAAAAGRGAGEPMALTPGPQLFIDDALIGEQKNLQRKIHRPARLSEPVVRAQEDKCFQPYLSVLRDPETGRFRMWYDVAVTAGQSHIGYIESEDGVRWIRPHRVLDDPAKIIFGVSVLDEGANFPDRARRYTLAWWSEGMWIARSADGLAWKAEPPHPVLTDINDILSIAFDPYRRRYVAVFGYPSNAEDGYKGHTQNSREGYRRCVGHSFSPDGVAWAPPRRIFKPDEKDEGITEFYSVGGVVARGGLLIGLLKVLRDDLPCDAGGAVNGIGYTVLAWTRDGERWERDREPFFDRNPVAGSWDHAMAWMDCQLPVGDEIYIYYGGYARGHKVERFTERQIGLARLPRDRYVSRSAGDAEGALTTPPLLFKGRRLRVNARVADGGSLRVALLDGEGRALPDFSADACESVRGNAPDAEVRWKAGGDVGAQAGKPVRLRITLRNADLFAFEFVEP